MKKINLVPARPGMPSGHDMYKDGWAQMQNVCDYQIDFYAQVRLDRGILM